jgi:hypothetical protein
MKIDLNGSKSPGIATNRDESLHFATLGVSARPSRRASPSTAASTSSSTECGSSSCSKNSSSQAAREQRCYRNAIESSERRRRRPADLPRSGQDRRHEFSS